MKKNSRPNAASALPRAQQGLSLVELMVALAIGLVVVGAVLVSYLGSSKNSQQSTSLAQMTEDATVALNLLRTQIAMAGYSRPVGVSNGTDATGKAINVMDRAYRGFANDSNDFIVGCDGALGGFADNRAKDLDISELACQTGKPAGAPDVIAVAYEADESNTMNMTGTTTPTDCLGQELMMRNEAGIQGNTYVASNRFFIATSGTTGESELYCQGNGGSAGPPSGTDTIASSTPQPLVENIVDLQITYGIADTQTVGPTTHILKEARRYLDASAIRAMGTGPTPSSDLWNRVVSVRLCVEVKSAKPAAPGETAEAKGGYVNCQGNAVPFPDNHLHRSFWTTVVLHNRL